MSNSSVLEMTKSNSPAPAVINSAVLQRKCDCGQHTIAGGECVSCAGARQSVMHTAISNVDRATEIQTKRPAPAGSELVADFAQNRGSSLMHRSAVGGGADPADAAAPPDAAPAAQPDAGPVAPEPKAPGPGAPAPPVAPAALSWSHVLRHKNDALWFFCGEHPAGFSTDAQLRAAGYANPATLSWRITAGADKVAIRGATAGAEITVESRAGSTHRDDVSIEVSAGAGAAAPTFAGHLTVLRPHRLIHRGADTDHAACPGWAACPVACPAYWTEIGYRVVDNMSGTIVGATVNENFPGAKTDDQVNDWQNPAAFITTPFWPNTNGTFVDNWFKFCGTPSPVAPGAAGAATGVDRIPHEFYVGSTTPANGCRVQTHTAHRHLGFTRHEGITTPAP